MKRIAAIAIAIAVVLVFGVAIMGCSKGPEVSQEEATKAINVAFGSFFIAVLSAGFGEEPEGVEVDEEGGIVTFTDFDLADLETQYTSISGVFDGSDDNEFFADLELAGGPVMTIEFEMIENATEIDITVNGHDMTISTDEIANWNR